MRNSRIILALLLLSAGTAWAQVGEFQVISSVVQQPPDPAPAATAPCYKSLRFWIPTAAAVGVALWDGIETDRALRRCPTCFEENSLLGGRPSRARVLWIGGASLAGERLLICALWNRAPNVADALNFGATAGRIIIHTRFAVRNRGICPANGAGCRAISPTGGGD